MRPNYDVREEYIGTGSVTEYQFSFKITDKAQLLLVSLDDEGAEVFRVRGDDITVLEAVTFDPLDGGGSIELQDALPDGHGLFIMYAYDDPTQERRYRLNQEFTPRRIEDAFDEVYGVLQRLMWLTKRTFGFSDHVLDSDAATFTKGIQKPTVPKAIIIMNEDLDGLDYGPPVDVIYGWMVSAQQAADAATEAAVNAENARDAAIAAKEAAEEAASAGGDAEEAAEAAQEAAEEAKDAAEAAQLAAENAAASIGALWRSYTAAENDDTSFTQEKFDTTTLMGVDCEIIVKRGTLISRCTLNALWNDVNENVDMIISPEKFNALEDLGIGFAFDIVGDEAILYCSLDAGDNAEVIVKTTTISSTPG